jgi:ABC-type multidrug transport system ATPase subunit
MSHTPLSIEWEGLGKRFVLKWVLRDLNGAIQAGTHIVVRGANGSGKSTLGKLLVAATDATDGEIKWKAGDEVLEIDDVPQRISWAAPFMEVPEEMEVGEVLEFHTKFRKNWDGVSLDDLALRAGLSPQMKSQVKTLSSGQKQRLMLILAMGTESGLVVLDEPCSNLDESGIKWYVEELKCLVAKTTVVVCSNNRPEEHLEGASEIILD